jgi:hypothetical protein
MTTGSHFLIPLSAPDPVHADSLVHYLEEWSLVLLALLISRATSSQLQTSQERQHMRGAVHLYHSFLVVWELTQAKLALRVTLRSAHTR